ncbi:short transient receptor potential channel 4-like, partial [Convolutriloba macropyga]|uniref:short transient receptor potential channel 4-like n=1 Tax=Convolutriloba macropyga TaxID=536237 RepID=UPI003F5259C3
MPQYNQISDPDRVHLKILRGDTTTSTKERQYLMAVEKGDFTSVKFFLEDAAIYFNMDMNCIDALGRTALHIGSSSSITLRMPEKSNFYSAHIQ